MPATHRATAPVLVSILMRPLPLQPLQLLLSSLTARLASRNAAMFSRIGEHALKKFGIVPTDMPFAFILRPAPECPALNVVRRLDADDADAVIRGPLMSLIALAEGRADGDALFFSRELLIEGDIGAVLALRNAIDDAQLDIAVELTAPLGPLAAPARALLKSISGRIAPGPVQEEPAASWS